MMYGLLREGGRENHVGPRGGGGGLAALLPTSISPSLVLFPDRTFLWENGGGGNLPNPN